jgi:hypothetical protein
MKSSRQCLRYEAVIYNQPSFFLYFVLQSRLNDKINIYDYFMNRSNVLQRVNQHIVAQSIVHNLCGKGKAPAASCTEGELGYLFSLSEC